MGRGLYRGIYSVLLDDADYQELSAPGRHTLLTLRLSRDAGPAALFRFYREAVVRQTGLTPRQVERALQELEEKPTAEAPWIVLDRPLLLVWIRNGLRHDPNTTLANQNHRKAVLRWLEGLPRSPIIARFCAYYDLPTPSGIPSEWDAPSHRDHRSPSPSPNTEEETTSSSPALREEAAAIANGHAPSSWGTPEALVDLYNKLIPPGHPRATRLSPKRRKQVHQALLAFPEERFWTGVVSEIKLSAFLRHGGKERPNFRGDFDWLLVTGKNGTENALKVHEGKYRDKEL